MWAAQAALVPKNPPANAGDMGGILIWEDCPEEGRAPHSSGLDWRVHGHRRLTGYNPQGHKESDTIIGTAHTHM